MKMMAENHRPHAEVGPRGRMALDVVDLGKRVQLPSGELVILDSITFAVEAETPLVELPRVRMYTAEIFDAAGIPTTSIDVVHPNAIFMGADNYTSGFIAGQHAGQHQPDRRKEGSLHDFVRSEAELTKEKRPDTAGAVSSLSAAPGWRGWAPASSGACTRRAWAKRWSKAK
mgnify:CR=1 FL=1